MSKYLLCICSNSQEDEKKESETKRMLRQLNQEKLSINELPPEMLESIFNSLDSYNLLVCRATSKQWKLIADTILEQRVITLWEPTSLSPSSRAKQLSLRFIGPNEVSYFCKEFRKIRKYKGNLIATGSVHLSLSHERVLEVPGKYATLWKAVQSFTNIMGRYLTSLTLEIYCFNRSLTHNGVVLNSRRQLCNILSKMPNLKALTIMGIFLQQKDPKRFKDKELPKLESLTYLHLLAEGHHWCDNKVCKWFLQSFAGQLVTLRCHQEVLSRYFTENSTQTGHLQQLQGLLVSTRSNVVSCDNLMPTPTVDWLETCPSSGTLKNLKCLWVQCTYLEFVKTLTNLDKVGSSLEQVHFEIIYNGEDEPLDEAEASLIPTHKTVVAHVSLGNYTGRYMRSIVQNVSVDTFDQVATHVETLADKEKIPSVKMLTLRWLHTTSYWKNGGLYWTMEMFPNLETIHLTECNQWKYTGGNVWDPAAVEFVLDLTLQNELARELKKEGYGENLMKICKELKTIAFFPDMLTSERENALLICNRSANGNITNLIKKGMWSEPDFGYEY